MSRKLDTYAEIRELDIKRIIDGVGLDSRPINGNRKKHSGRESIRTQLINFQKK